MKKARKERHRHRNCVSVRRSFPHTEAFPCPPKPFRTRSASLSAEAFPHPKRFSVCEAFPHPKRFPVRRGFSARIGFFDVSPKLNTRRKPPLLFRTSPGGCRCASAAPMLLRFGATQNRTLSAGDLAAVSGRLPVLPGTPMQPPEHADRPDQKPEPNVFRSGAPKQCART